MSENIGINHQQTSASPTLPLFSNVVQRRLADGRSYSLSIQRIAVRDSPAEFRENVPKEIHSIGVLLCPAAQHEAHLHVHGTDLLCLSVAALLRC